MSHLTQYVQTDVQATVTDICIMETSCLHKHYVLELKELSQSNLSFISRFALPLKATMRISIKFLGEQMYLLVEVIGNQRVESGRYRVIGEILYCRSNSRNTGTVCDWINSKQAVGIH